MARFADELDRHQAHVPFKCQSRVDLLLRDGEIDAFRRAGAHTVWVGAESGSQKILDAMEKGTRVEQIAEATRRMHEAGIRVGFFLQFGYPGEDRGDIEKTRQMVRDCQPDEIGMSVSYPLPGTAFHERVRDELGLKQNWVDSDDLDMMFAGTYATGFYRQLYRVLHKEFRSRSAARLLMKALGSRARVDRGAIRLAAAVLYHGATLPIARLRLERQMRRSIRAVTALRQRMTPEQAAEPTPQEVE
jgi:anaerobic magnesium-protoporphyrin IX monomethyl ester cyclase